MSKKSIIAIIITIVVSIIVITVVTTKSTATTETEENSNNFTNVTEEVKTFSQYSNIEECPNVRTIDIAKAINEYTQNNKSIFVRNNPGVFIDASKDTKINPYLILAFTAIKYGWNNESTINFRDTVYDTAYMIKDVFAKQENCKTINDMVLNTNCIDQQSAYTIVDIVNTSYKNM